MTAAGPPGAELVRRTLAGDRDAFARLYDRYARLVRAVAADAGAGQAEDVVQDAFLRAYRAPGALRDADRFGPWPIGIARPVVREAGRRAAALPLPGGLPDGRPHAEAAADDAGEIARPRALVARSPDDERRAVEFFFPTGRDAAETARLLGRSRSGTYALLRAAVGTLARRMAAARPGEEVTR